MLDEFYLELYPKTKFKRINFISSRLINFDRVEVESILWKIEGVIQFSAMELTSVLQYDVFVDCIWFYCFRQVTFSKKQSNL